MHAIDVVIYRDEDQWVAQALNVEVSSFRSSADEARAAIVEALALYFEDGELVDIHESAEAQIEQLQVA